VVATQQLRPAGVAASVVTWQSQRELRCNRNLQETKQQDGKSSAGKASVSFTLELTPALTNFDRFVGQVLTFHAFAGGM